MTSAEREELVGGSIANLEAGDLRARARRDLDLTISGFVNAGVGVREVADVLGVSPESVYQALRRVRELALARPWAFNELVRDAREALGLGLADFGGRTGLTPAEVVALERRERLEMPPDAEREKAAIRGIALGEYGPWEEERA